MDIVVIEDPSAEDTKFIEDGILEYGLSQVNGVTPQKWAFHAIEAKEIIGGATGRIHFSQFYLDNLWVVETSRSKGYGTMIHTEIEKCAIDTGCNRIQLNTLNERAVEFYMRLGYETLATIENYVDGFNLQYMAKKI